MKHLPTVAVALLAAGLALAAMGPAEASGTAWADAQVLPDPSLANGPVFRPSAATAGTAAVSAVADSQLVDCSRKNPCATPTPARDQVVVIARQAKPGTVPHVAAQPASAAKAVQPGDAGRPSS
jgi:hypothetical protein